MLLTSKSEMIYDRRQLLEIFLSGCKTSQNIGVETEKLLVYKNSKKAVEYIDVVKILSQFDENIWQRVYENEKLIGLKSDIGTISLEPGSQIELSLKPFECLSEINDILKDYYNQLNEYAQNIGTEVLDIGAHPVSTYENINVIPKKRYEYMTKYLPTKGLTPFVMMRETAGIQVNFDYKSEDDAIRKLSLATKMSPFISAIYANSPIRDNKLNGYKSFRANSWLNVDNDRCGYISQKLFDKNEHFSFDDYVEVLLDVPMIFIQRGNNCYQTNQTFRDFMQNGFGDIKAEISDWETHLSLYFPDVRLKNYVEIRNHDAQNFEMTKSVFAFWKGIIYNQNAMEEIEKILNKFEYEDYMQLREDSPKYAIESRIKNYKILDFIKEFFDISYSSLKENNLNEENYLNCVYECISLGKTKADYLIK